MDWLQLGQFITIISVFLGAFGYIHSDIKTFKDEIRKDMQQQTSRTDRLYEMFIDLLKDRKKE